MFYSRKIIFMINEFMNSLIVHIIDLLNYLASLHTMRNMLKIFFLIFLQLPPRLIKLTLVTCLLVVIISQTDCAEGNFITCLCFKLSLSTQSVVFIVFI